MSETKGSFSLRKQSIGLLSLVKGMVSPKVSPKSERSPIYRYIDSMNVNGTYRCNNNFPYIFGLYFSQYTALICASSSFSDIKEENQDADSNELGFKKASSCSHEDIKTSGSEDTPLKSYVPLVAQIASRIIE